MNIWWHNGGVRMDPENDEERAALLVLWRGATKELPEEQRVQNGSGTCVSIPLLNPGSTEQRVVPGRVLS